MFNILLLHKFILVSFFAATSGRTFCIPPILPTTYFFVNMIFVSLLPQYCGPGSVVGITTSYEAGRSGDRNLVGARFSASVQTGPGVHPASCTMGTGSFPGVKSGRDVTLTPHPPSSAMVMKE